MKVKKGGIVKQEKSGEVQKLKNRIKRLEKMNRILVQKLNTLEQVLEENSAYLKDHTEDISVEDLIEAAKTKKTLEETKQARKCPDCGADNLLVLPTLFGSMESCKCGYKRTIKK